MSEALKVFAVNASAVIGLGVGLFVVIKMNKELKRAGII